MTDRLILFIRKRYFDLLLSGVKSLEIRRGDLSKRLQGKSHILYLCGPGILNVPIAGFEVKPYLDVSPEDLERARVYDLLEVYPDIKPSDQVTIITLRCESIGD